MHTSYVILLVLLAALCFTVPLTAEESGTQQAFIPAYLQSYPGTIWDGITSPARWDSGDWLKATVFIGIGTGLYFLDEDIDAMLRRNHTPLLDGISFGFKQFGEGKYLFPLSGATILAGYITGSEHTSDTGFLCLKSLLISGAATNTLKYITQRQRPVSGNGNGFWNGEGFIRRRDSFPSGHATIVWSLAPILASQYPDSKWVAPTAYTIATLTSLSRAYDHRHWSSDVFVASVIGYFTARLTLKTTPRLQIMPNAQSGGINLLFYF
jgi:hypothetical protein